MRIKLKKIHVRQLLSIVVLDVNASTFIIIYMKWWLFFCLKMLIVEYVKKQNTKKNLNYP